MTSPFIRPIEGAARFICIEEGGDVAIMDNPPLNQKTRCFEIKPQDLTGFNAFGQTSDKVSATYDAIDAWLKKHCLSREDFLIRKKSSSGSSGNYKLIEFLKAFDGLSHEDLARIEIPLDIMVKLNSGK